MAAYTMYLNQSTSEANALLNSGRWALNLVRRLKETPYAWTTVGSSTDDGVTPAYSATPDGVDRWGNPVSVLSVKTGGSGDVWHVLRSQSGLEVCITLTGSCFINLVVAKNGFSTGGTWRGGGTNANTRPTDVTSSPEYDREVVAAATGTQCSGASNPIYWHLWKRADGQGFMSVSTHTGTAHAHLGVYRMSAPRTADTNPYILCAAPGLDLVTDGNNTPTSGYFRGRKPTDGIGPYDGISLMPRSADLWATASAADPFGAKRIRAEIAAFSKNGSGVSHIRLAFPGIFVVPDGRPLRETINSRTGIILGDVSFPWDGTTIPLPTDGGDSAYDTVYFTDQDPFVVVAEETAEAAPVSSARSFASNLDRLGDEADQFGIDVDCVSDHGTTLTIAGGYRNLGNAIARRLMTPRGGLFYDQDYGVDLREWVNEGLTDAGVSELVNLIESEIRKDARVRDASAEMTFDRTTSTLSVFIDLETVIGPHRLVLSVDQVTAKVLNEGL